MKNITIISVFSVLLISCNSQNQKCSRRDFKNLDLLPVKISIKMPPYQIVDTTRYGRSRTILNYKIKSLDGLLDVVVFVDDYSDYADNQFDINRIALSQKQEVESGQNDKKLLTESIKKNNGLEVGYLKYLVKQTSNKFYASRIFFYKGKKLIVLWLFDRNGNAEDRSMSDCIIESLKIQ